MIVTLAYGDNGLDVELPDDRTTVIEPRFLPGLPDEDGALKTAIRNPIGTRPLRQLVAAHQTVAISVCDITRPAPTRLMLPALLRELEHVPPEQVTILIATGTHRANTPDELDAMLGPGIAGRYPVVNHDAFDDANEPLQASTPTCASQPGSSSPIFSQASPAVQKWWLRVWPGSPRQCTCTTPPV